MRGGAATAAARGERGCVGRRAVRGAARASGRRRVPLRGPRPARAHPTGPGPRRAPPRGPCAAECSGRSPESGPAHRRGPHAAEALCLWFQGPTPSYVRAVPGAGSCPAAGVRLEGSAAWRARFPGRLGGGMDAWACSVRFCALRPGGAGGGCWPRRRGRPRRPGRRRLPRTCLAPGAPGPADGCAPARPPPRVRAAPRPPRRCGAAPPLAPARPRAGAGAGRAWRMERGAAPCHAAPGAPTPPAPLLSAPVCREGC
jgi:hypothetical protein